MERIPPQHMGLLAYTDTVDQLLFAFLRELPNDIRVISEQIKFTADVSPSDFLDAVCSALNRPVISVTGYTSGIIIVRTQQSMTMIRYPAGSGFTDIARGSCHASITGEMDLVSKAASALKDFYKDRNLAEVEWWFYAKPGEADSASTILERPKPVHDAFYPFIGEGIDAYQKRYLDDDATILFLMGPPGTGKTSFIRHMIYQHRLSAIVTYEPGLLESDRMFVNFITGSANIMVLEDADTLLDNREASGNKMISRFLNISDGLIKFRGKKIVFTTNLKDFSNVDQALIRPGRCFGAIKFRPLREQEIDHAWQATGKDLKHTFQAETTLAQLFGGRGATIARPVGFSTNRPYGSAALPDSIV